MHENMNQGLDSKPAIRNIATGPNSTKYQSSNTSLLIKENNNANIAPNYHYPKRSGSKEGMHGEIIIDDYGCTEDALGDKRNKNMKTTTFTMNSFFPSQLGNNHNAP